MSNFLSFLLDYRPTSVTLQHRGGEFAACQQPQFRQSEVQSYSATSESFQLGISSPLDWNHVKGVIQTVSLRSICSKEYESPFHCLFPIRQASRAWKVLTFTSNPPLQYPVSWMKEGPREASSTQAARSISVLRASFQHILPQLKGSSAAESPGPVTFGSMPTPPNTFLPTEVFQGCVSCNPLPTLCFLPPTVAQPCIGWLHSRDTGTCASCYLPGSLVLNK